MSTNRRFARGARNRRIVTMALLATLLPPSAYGLPPASEPVIVSTAVAEESTVFNSTHYGARIEPYATYRYSAPFDGVVTELPVQVGQSVAPGDVVAKLTRRGPGQRYRPGPVEALHAGRVAEQHAVLGQELRAGEPLLTVVDDSRLTLVALVSDKDIAAIATGEACVVHSASAAHHRARIARVPLVPSEGGLFPVRITVEEPEGLRIGQFVRVELRYNRARAVLVERSHLEMRNGAPHLWVINDGSAELRSVETGRRFGTSVSVAGGLEVGERYVTGSAQPLADGSAVREQGGT